MIPDIGKLMQGSDMVVNKKVTVSLPIAMVFEATMTGKYEIQNAGMGNPLKMYEVDCPYGKQFVWETAIYDL